TNQNVIDKYWSSGIVTSGSQVFTPVGLSYVTNPLLDSFHITNSASLQLVGSSSAQYFLSTQVPRTFKTGYEYSLASELLCLKNAVFEGVIDVYLSGSSFPSSNPLGLLIDTLTSPSISTRTYFSLSDTS